MNPWANQDIIYVPIGKMRENKFKAEFLNVDTINILGRILLCWAEGETASCAL